MTRTIARIGAPMLLGLTLFAGAADAQDARPPERQLHWSVEGAAGLHTHYTGTHQSVAVGFAPSRNLTLLAGAERSHTEDEITYYPDGFGASRGGRVEFVSVEVRYAFFADKRISPYAVIGGGRGRQRQNESELFPPPVERNMVAMFYGGGARIPIHRRLDAFADFRLIIIADDGSEMSVVGPIRAGLSFRF